LFLFSGSRVSGIGLLSMNITSKKKDSFMYEVLMKKIVEMIVEQMNNVCGVVALCRKRKR
jgi:hypothetical protein